MLLPILTLSLEKEISILAKVWKKSYILHPKLLMNPVSESKKKIGGNPAFFR